MPSALWKLAVAGAVGTALLLPTDGAALAAIAAQPLVGTFRIAAGACNGASVTGSTFRMVLPSGTTAGPFVSNNDSACADKSFTLLSPGTDGGLLTGSYQGEPNPGFDGSGNSLAARVTKPVGFYGTAFSTSTNGKDPQTGVAVPASSLAVQDGKLTGDLRAFAASWNRQEFNQGAPKPDGSYPGITAAPSGTYDPATHAFTLSWASQIQGGPFNSFTGLWHLEGTFVPAAAESTPTSTGTVRPSTPVSSGTGAASTQATAPSATRSRVASSPTTAPSAQAVTKSTTGGTAASGTADVPTSAVAAPVTLDPSSETTAVGQSGGQVAAASTGGGSSPVWPLVLVALLLLAGGAAAMAFRRFRPRTGGAQ